MAIISRLSVEKRENEIPSRLNRTLRECVAFPVILALVAVLPLFFLLSVFCGSACWLIRKITGSSPIKMTIRVGY